MHFLKVSHNFSYFKFFLAVPILAPAPAPVLVEAPKIVEVEPCAPEPVPVPVPIIPQLTQIVPAPVRIVPQAPVVIDAPYPARLPFPTHYGEPVLPLKYLLLNNAV